MGLRASLKSLGPCALIALVSWPHFSGLPQGHRLLPPRALLPITGLLPPLPPSSRTSLCLPVPLCPQLTRLSSLTSSAWVSSYVTLKASELQLMSRLTSHCQGPGGTWARAAPGTALLCRSHEEVTSTKPPFSPLIIKRPWVKSIKLLTQSKFSWEWNEMLT